MRRSITVVLSVLIAGLVWSGGTEQRSAEAFPSLRTLPAHSRNFTRRSTRSIRRIVLHTTEGSEQSAINTFQNPSSRVSAHYLVARSGRLTRLVQDKDVAYHVRNHNQDTIGIENEGRASNPNQWTPAMMNKLVDLVRGLCDRYGIPKSRSHILSHAELDPRRRVDPGPYFPWNELIRRINNGSTPTQQTYIVRSGDTLSAIAARTGVSQATLQRLNGISNPNQIFPGQVLRLTGSATTPPPPPPPASSSFLAEVTASSLNVRTRAFGTVLGSVSRGSKFVVNRTTNGWSRIHYRGRDAWVSARYLKRTSGTAVNVAASTLNVRTGAGTGFRVLGTVARSQDYVRLGQNGNWTLIQFDGRRGYVHQSYLRASSVR